MRTSLRRPVFVAACVAVALAAFSSTGSANHSWNGYHWARTSSPFTLQLGDNVSPAWDGYLGQASSEWSQSSVLNTTVVAGQAKPRNCRPTSGRVEVCDATYGNTGWLGVAQIWVSGGHITQGVVKLNDTYFNTATYNTPAWRQMVTCQEIGHTFGLDHQDENFGNTNLGTCMDYSNDPSGTAGTNGNLANTSPNQHDYDELVNIYGHLDGSTTVGGTVPPAMNAIDLDGPPQWGRVVRGSRAAGFSIHELDFGHGHFVYTFVTWARAERGHQPE